MTTLNLEVDFSADDADEAGNGTVLITATSTNTVDATNEWIGLRFRGVTITGGSTINSATLSMVPFSSATDEPNHPIYCDDSDNAAAFSTSANNISSRARTTATVTWSSTNLGANGSTRFNAPDVAALVQEVIDRAGWASGNAIAFVIQGSADSTRDLAIVTFDGSAANAAHLDIDYTAGAGPTEVNLTGAQPSSAGALTKLYKIARAGSQPTSTGALTKLQTLARAVAGTHPASAGALATKYLISLSGSQPAPSGALAAVTVIALSGSEPASSGALAQKYLIALAGTEPAKSGTLAKLQTLARSLAGSQPASAGTLTLKYLIVLAGSQPVQTGSLTALQALAIALSGSQPASTGALSASTSGEVGLTGAQPASSGALAALQDLARSLAGAQPTSTGALTVQQSLRRSLAGNEPAPSGALVVVQTLLRGLAGAQPASTAQLLALQTLAIALAGTQPAATGTLTVEEQGELAVLSPIFGRARHTAARIAVARYVAQHIGRAYYDPEEH